MNMLCLRPLVINTIQKEVRSKVLWGFAIVTILVMLLTNAGIDFVIKFAKDSFPFADMSGKKMAIFTVVMNMWSAFLGVYFGINAVKSDEEAQVVPLLLSFPISRATYLFSRLLGSALLVCSYYFLSIILALLLFTVSSGSFPFEFSLIGSWVSALLVLIGSLPIGALLGLFLSRAMCLVASFFLLPWIFSANTILNGQKFSEHFQNISIIKSIGLILYYFFPRIGIWSGISTAMALDGKWPSDLGMQLAHYTIAMGIISALILIRFKRKGY